MAVLVKTFWVVIEPVDPELGATFSVNFTSLNHQAATYADGQTPLYYPYLEEYPTTSISAFDGEFDGKASVEIDDLRISYRGPLTEAQCSRAVWDGAKVSLYRGFVDLETATVQSKTLVVTGAVEGNPTTDNGVSTFKVVDLGYLLERDLLTSTYLGTGGYEGSDGYAGVFRPMAIGYPTNIAPALIDPNYVIYQYHGHGKSGGVLSLWENGIDFGSAKSTVPWQGTEAATFNTLRNVSLSVGEWADAPSIGCFRLGGEPAEGGVITCDVAGAVNGSGVVYTSFVECIEYLLSLTPLAGEFDAANFDAFQSLLGAGVDIGEYIEEQVTLDEVLTRWLAPAGAYRFIDHLGKVTLGVVRIGAVADFTVRSDGRTLPAYEEAKALGVSAPYKTVRVGYQRAHRVQGPTEISDAVKQALLQAEYVNAAIYDAMLYDSVAEFLGRWDNVNGGPVARIATNDTGGAAFVLGDNNGSDDTTLVYKYRRLPYSPEDVYEVTFDVEAVGLSTTKMYLGVATYDASGNLTSTDTGGYAYFAAQGVVQNGLTRRTYRGYFRGTADVGTGANVGLASNEQANPNPVATGTAWVAPVVVANTLNGGVGGTGAVTIHEVNCRKIEDAAVIATGAWDSTRSYYRNEGVTFNNNYFASRADGNLNHQPPSTATSDSNWYLVLGGVTGSSGSNGDSIVELTVFQRSSSGAPATPTGGSYDFGSKILTPPAGWSTVPPAGTDPCYAARGVASINGTTGTDTPDWFGVGQAFANGSNGADGKSVDVVFQRSTTQPAAPSASSGVPAGWYTDVASVPAGSGPIWASFGEKPSGATNYTWGTPSKIEATDGTSNIEITVFKRSASGAPTAPAGGSYDFGSKTLTPPTGWTTDVPSGTDPCYAARGVASINGTIGTDVPDWFGVGLAFSNGSNGLDGKSIDVVFQRNTNQPSTPAASAGVPAGWYTDVNSVPAGAGVIWASFGEKATGASTYTWQTPSKVEATDGQSIAEVNVFQRASSAPAAPTGGSYNFTTKVLTPPAGWSLTPPAGNNPCYVARGVAFVVGQTGTATPSWLGVGLAFQNGADGAAGDAVDVIFQRSTSQPSTPAPSSGVPAGWYTDTNSVPAGSGVIWASFGTRPNSTGNYTWQTPKKVEGTDGANGAPGLTISPASGITVACFDNGNAKPGELPKSFSIKVFSGTTDVTASCTFTATNTNCSVSNDGGGNFSLTAISADSAQSSIAITYGGVSATQVWKFTKSKDGSSATSSGTTVASVPTSTSYAVVASVDLAVNSGASVNGNFSVQYKPSPPDTSVGSYELAGYLTLQNITDGGTETTVAGPTVGSLAQNFPADVSHNSGFLSLAGGAINGAGVKTWRLRLYLKKNSGTSGGTVENGPALLQIQGG